MDTHQKALEINLDPTIFGSFAEIGAGQEVARWFLRVGAASGTVAKTICAYDKEVSDDLYGAGSRYVSRPRLEAMLDREWQQLLLQLSKTRGPKSRFFAFADTISARNFAGTNEPHGWLGIRFQKQPADNPSDILIHVHLMDPSSSLQQEAVGILGVNLVYAVSRQMESKDSFLIGLSQEIAGRIEIDSMDWRGPSFESWDHQSLLIELVTRGMTQAAAFLPDGKILPPTEIFHNKSVVLAPGMFDVVEPIHNKMLANAIQDVSSETGAPCIGMYALASGAEIPRRLESLLQLGHGVLLTQMKELYKMAAYVKRYTGSIISFAIGLPLLIRVLEDAYGDLEGHTLEGISRLFTQNVRVCVYPMTLSSNLELVQSMREHGWEITDEDGWLTAGGIRPRTPIKHLYDYLLACGFVISMRP